MKTLIIAAAITLSSIAANALPKDSDLWYFVASSDTNGVQYSALKGSGHFAKNDVGYDVYVATGRGVETNGHTNAIMWYVPVESCPLGRGFLVTMDTNGKFLFNTEFALGSGTVASYIAETLCVAMESTKEDVTTKPAAKPTKKSTKNTTV